MEVSVSKTYNHTHDKNGEIHVKQGKVKRIEESPVQQRFDNACLKFREDNMDFFDETQLLDNTAIPKFSSIGKWKLDSSANPPSKKAKADADDDFDPTDLIQDVPTTQILNIDGEEHWKDENKCQEYNDKVIEAIDKYKRVFFQGHAGCGKSYWIQKYAEKYQKQLFVCPCRKDRTLRDGRQKLHIWARRTEPAILWLEGADDLTPEAQAFLRRILETHASEVLFILECRDAGRLQEPIRSRCKIKRMYLPTWNELEEFLVKTSFVEYN
mgnify:CR=1 FL=1